MTMTIIDKIKASITAATGLSVYYHDEPSLNMMADDMTLPCAVVTLIREGRVEMQSGQVREEVNVAVWFAALSDFDFDAEENEAIIDGCKQSAFAWLAANSRDTYIDIVNVRGTSRIYERFDAILTGFAMNVEVRELNGYCN